MLGRRKSGASTAAQQLNRSFGDVYSPIALSAKDFMGDMANLRGPDRMISFVNDLIDSGTIKRSSEETSARGYYSHEYYHSDPITGKKQQVSTINVSPRTFDNPSSARKTVWHEQAHAYEFNRRTGLGVNREAYRGYPAGTIRDKRLVTAQMVARKRLETHHAANINVVNKLSESIASARGEFFANTISSRIWEEQHGPRKNIDKFNKNTITDVIDRNDITGDLLKELDTALDNPKLLGATAARVKVATKLFSNQIIYPYATSIEEAYWMISPGMQKKYPKGFTAQTTPFVPDYLPWQIPTENLHPPQSISIENNVDTVLHARAVSKGVKGTGGSIGRYMRVVGKLKR